MADLRAIFLSMRKSFRTWKTSPRVYLVFLIQLLFQWYGFEGYAEVAKYLGVPMSLCIFPFFVGMPIDAYSFGANPMILYSEAPFNDHYAPFMLIRTGKRNWILGQILYLFLSSLLYTIVSVLLSFVVLLPNVEFNFDWGSALWTLALNPELIDTVGVRSMVPGLSLMEAMSGETAMLYSILLYWLVTFFLGMVILCFNIVIKKGAGTLLAGLLTCFSYFVNSIGTIIVGRALRWISPVCWRTLFGLGYDPYSYSPPIPYAITVLSVSIIIMAVVSVIVFCKKDLEFEKGEY